MNTLDLEIPSENPESVVITIRADRERLAQIQRGVLEVFSIAMAGIPRVDSLEARPCGCGEDD